MTAALVRALLGRRRWLCALIDWLRPGAGHDWLEMCDPPMCRHCATSRIEWRLL